MTIPALQGTSNAEEATSHAAGFVSTNHSVFIGMTKAKVVPCLMHIGRQNSTQAALIELNLKE
jgi:hypothetical protein